MSQAKTFCRVHRRHYRGPCPLCQDNVPAYGEPTQSIDPGFQAQMDSLLFPRDPDPTSYQVDTDTGSMFSGSDDATGFSGGGGGSDW